MAKKAEAIENCYVKMGQNRPCSQVPSHMEAKTRQPVSSFCKAGVTEALQTQSQTALVL